jgi:hypothetical protein
MNMKLSWNYPNPNIGFVTKCEMQGPMKLIVCLSVKHIFTNGDHSTCISRDNLKHKFYRPLLLVVQVDLILNSRLWICPSPIPKF